MAAINVQAPSRQHYIGALTGAVMALAAGGGAIKSGIAPQALLPDAAGGAAVKTVRAPAEGLIPHWEGGGEKISVAVHQSFDPKGVITVCRGHTNLDDPKLKAGDRYTAAMCDALLKADLPKYNAQLASCLPKNFMVGDHQHAAMLSFVYNVGKGNFCSSSVGRAFREGRRFEACHDMGKFTRAAGHELKGLQNRRYDKFWGEIAWCMRDD